MAKKAALTVVRSDIFGKTPQGEDRSELGGETWIDALGQTHDSIQNNQRQGKAVVSMSIGVDRSLNQEYQQALEDTYTYILNSIM